MPLFLHGQRCLCLVIELSATKTRKIKLICEQWKKTLECIAGADEIEDSRTLGEIVFVLEGDIDGNEIERLSGVDLFEPFDEDECAGIFDDVPIAGRFEFIEGGETIEVEVSDGFTVCVITIDDGEGGRADVSIGVEVGICDAVDELCFSDAQITAQRDDVAGFEESAQLFSEFDGFLERMRQFHRMPFF